MGQRAQTSLRVPSIGIETMSRLNVTHVIAGAIIQYHDKLYR